jgi:hypothetical protein
MKKLFFSLIICATPCFGDEQQKVQFILPDEIPANYEKFNDKRKTLTSNYLGSELTVFLNKRCSDSKEDQQKFGKLTSHFSQATETMMDKVSNIYLTNANNVETNEQAKEEIAALTNDYLHSVIHSVNQIDALFVETNEKNKEKTCVNEIETFLKKVSENSNDTTGGTH